MSKATIQVGAAEVAEAAKNLKYIAKAYYLGHQNGWTREEIKKVRACLLEASSDIDTADNVMIDFMGLVAQKEIGGRLKTLPEIFTARGVEKVISEINKKAYGVTTELAEKGEPDSDYWDQVGTRGDE